MLAISRFAKHWFESFQQHRARKAKNCSKSSFSGLRTEFQEQPINTKRACQILYHNPEKQRIAPKARFRGCGRNSKSSQWIQNVLVRSYHSPEKQRIAPNARFRGCGRNSTSS
jgi:hypothetical protein